MREFSNSVMAATEAAKLGLVVEDQLNDPQIQEKIKELQSLYYGGLLGMNSWNVNKDNQLINIIISLYSTVMAKKGEDGALRHFQDEEEEQKQFRANIERILKLFVKKEMENTWMRGWAGKKDIQTAVNDVTNMLGFFSAKANNRLFLRMGKEGSVSNHLSAIAKIVLDIINLLSVRLNGMDDSSFLTMA